jgi:hypothetical protein
LIDILLVALLDALIYQCVFGSDRIALLFPARAWLVSTGWGGNQPPHGGWLHRKYALFDYLLKTKSKLTN